MRACVCVSVLTCACVCIYVCMCVCVCMSVTAYRCIYTNWGNGRNCRYKVYLKTAVRNLPHCEVEEEGRPEPSQEWSIHQMEPQVVEKCGDEIL